MTAEKTPPTHPHDVEASELTSASTGKDVAIALVGEHAQAIDPAIEARVLRKIDVFLMPAMIVGMPKRLPIS
jgi:hypothetical protein